MRFLFFFVQLTRRDWVLKFEILLKYSKPEANAHIIDLFS